MAPIDEPKMAELKRLLRRLDGLDANRSASKAAALSEAEQRDYVGSLRGAPEIEDGEVAASLPTPARVSPSSAALLAGAAAAVISTATVYVFMSQPRPAGPDARQSPATERIVPGTSDYRSPENGAVPRSKGPDEVSTELVRSAAHLFEIGNIEAARELLRRAAEMGSGPAALTLARSYDPQQAQALAPAARQTNPALARAWYERAKELGVAQAELQPEGRR